MLDTYHHPDGQDMRYQRIRGYERFPGTIYKAMVTSIRQFKNKNISGKSRVEMSPYEVWSTIVKDPAVKMVEDINPIQNLKGSEIVTYVGEGGRAKEAMNKASRAYHVADMGIISEATVDSSDVGITAYMSANPNFKDQRGIGAHNGDIQPSRLLSTSALLAPCADQDD
jgi:CRISPR/Cas system-associated exonuclease Cas4 (RecB family)